MDHGGNIINSGKKCRVYGLSFPGTNRWSGRGARAVLMMALISVSGLAIGQIAPEPYKPVDTQYKPVQQEYRPVQQNYQPAESAIQAGSATAGKPQAGSLAPGKPSAGSLGLGRPAAGSLGGQISAGSIAPPVGESPATIGVPMSSIGVPASSMAVPLGQQNLVRSQRRAVDDDSSSDTEGRRRTSRRSR